MVPYGHANVLFILFVFFVVNAVSLKRDLFDLKKDYAKHVIKMTQSAWGYSCLHQHLQIHRNELVSMLKATSNYRQRFKYNVLDMFTSFGAEFITQKLSYLLSNITI